MAAGKAAQASQGGGQERCEGTMAIQGRNREMHRREIIWAVHIGMAKVLPRIAGGALCREFAAQRCYEETI